MLGGDLRCGNASGLDGIKIPEERLRRRKDASANLAAKNKELEEDDGMREEEIPSLRNDRCTALAHPPSPEQRGMRWSGNHGLLWKDSAGLTLEYQMRVKAEVRAPKERMVDIDGGRADLARELETMRAVLARAAEGGEGLQGDEEDGDAGVPALCSYSVIRDK